MILHHYSLGQPAVPIELGANNTILTFAKTKLVGTKKALYATTESYADSDRAHQMLSLTYYPKYEAIIDVTKITNLKVVNNINKALSLTSQTDIITRVWPAFGKSGGSHELLIIAPTEIQCTSNTLSNGGAPDMWHQDKVENYTPAIVELIATGIIDALETSDLGFLPTGEGYIVKAVGNGVATSSSLKQKKVTLSAAWKNLTSIPEFKFWACLWEDYDPLGIRAILRPYSETAILCRWFLLGFTTEDAKDYFRWELKNHGYVYSVLTETIKSLLRNVTLVSDEFFKYHSHKIAIPT
jgi:hypothetical protein